MRQTRCDQRVYDGARELSGFGKRVAPLFRCAGIGDEVMPESQLPESRRVTRALYLRVDQGLYDELIGLAVREAVRRAKPVPLATVAVRLLREALLTTKGS